MSPIHPPDATLAPPRARGWGRARHYALLALGLGLFGYTVTGADLGDATSLVAEIGPLALVVLLPQGAWTVVHAAAWRRLLAGLGRPVPLGGLATTYFTVESARLTFPAGPAVAESLSVYLLARRFGVPLADAIASIAEKRLLVVGSNAVYAALGVAAGWGAIATASSRLFGGSLLTWLIAGYAVALAALTAAVATVMRRGSLAMTIFRAVRAVPLARLRGALDARVDRWAAADEKLARPVVGRATPAVMMLAQWLLEAAETFLILRLLGLPIGIGEALALEVAGNALRSFAFAIPAGLGVQDAGYVAMIGALGAPEAASAGVAFVLVKRSKELFWVALGWLLVFADRRAGARIAEAEQA